MKIGLLLVRFGRDRQEFFVCGGGGGAYCRRACGGEEREGGKGNEIIVFVVSCVP